MITISLCMIVRNEQDCLVRCLSSVKGIVDEIIIVDTGSTDNTKLIAKDFEAIVEDFPWIDDFAAARNFSFSKATKEYVLWLDADDVIEEQDYLNLAELKRTLTPDYHSISMGYNLTFDKEGNVLTSLRRNRMVRRECDFKWVGAVHEYLQVSGKTLHSNVNITHKKNKQFTDRNLRIYQGKVARGDEFTPRDLYYYANELRDHRMYQEAAEYYVRFLETGQGWIEDNYQACLKLSECYQNLQDKERQFQALCKTLQYDKPRCDFCCRIAAYFFEERRFQQAIYWNQMAICLPEQDQSMGMKNAAASTWLPQLQLCLCYDRLGEYQKANYHNELGLGFSPTHQSMLYNRAYFQKLLGDQYVSLATIIQSQNHKMTDAGELLSP